MSAVPTDDRLSRGKLSHVRQGSVRWTPQPAGLTVPLETTDQPSPLRQHLRTLVLLRAVAAIVQLAVVWATVQILDVGLPLLPQLSLLAALLVLVAALALRLRFARPVTENEFFAHLLCDLAWLSFALYWAGGTLHNPFADLYIVYVGLAALTLRWRHVVATFLLALTAYALLRIHHVAPNAQSASLPIDELEAMAHASHFVLLASIVAYFGYRLSAAGRRYFEWLARTRARSARRHGTESGHARRRRGARAWHAVDDDGRARRRHAARAMHRGRNAHESGSDVAGDPGVQRLARRYRRHRGRAAHERSA